MALGDTRRRATRDRPHAHAQARQRVRVVPGRLRDGLPVLPRPARRASSATSTRPRSSSRSCTPARTDQRVTNVVYMGMGEPLANYEPVWKSVTRLHDDLGLSARRLTVSTVGVVPGMRRLAREALPVTLAVSLHAPDDELRSRLVPLNHRYPIAEILDTAADVAGAHGRHVTFEYAGIAGVNDGLDQAEALGRLLSTWPGVGGAHVNLIP